MTLLNRQAFKHNHAVWIEIFVASNLAFLVLDIYVAHSVNSFHHWTEWIPFYFALTGAALLFWGMVSSKSLKAGNLRTIGFIVGSCSIIVGIAGLILHLESNFFQALTLKALIYSAPFIAPLAFTGLGFLLILNRMVDHSTTVWGKWLAFFALGGFAGNFVLSLADHAQNGFFYITEWIPVVSSALAFGFLLTLIIQPLNNPLKKYGVAIILLQIIVGLLGAAFHIRPLFGEVSDDIFSQVIFGAPVFAPFLFVDIAVLSAIALWDLHRKSASPTKVSA